eukprot:CFRG5081T1
MENSIRRQVVPTDTANQPQREFELECNELRERLVEFENTKAELFETKRLLESLKDDVASRDKKIARLERRLMLKGTVRQCQTQDQRANVKGAIDDVSDTKCGNMNTKVASATKKSGSVTTRGLNVTATEKSNEGGGKGVYTKNERSESIRTRASKRYQFREGKDVGVVLHVDASENKSEIESEIENTTNDDGSELSETESENNVEELEEWNECWYPLCRSERVPWGQSPVSTVLEVNKKKAAENILVPNCRTVTVDLNELPVPATIEDMSDKAFDRRHRKYEVMEKRRKRADNERLLIEQHLEQQFSNHNHPFEPDNTHMPHNPLAYTTSFLPDPYTNLKVVEVTTELPFIAWGGSVPLDLCYHLRSDEDTGTKKLDSEEKRVKPFELPVSGYMSFQMEMMTKKGQAGALQLKNKGLNSSSVEGALHKHPKTHTSTVLNRRASRRLNEKGCMHVGVETKSENESGNDSHVPFTRGWRARSFDSNDHTSDVSDDRGTGASTTLNMCMWKSRPLRESRGSTSSRTKSTGMRTGNDTRAETVRGNVRRSSRKGRSADTATHEHHTQPSAKAPLMIRFKRVVPAASEV